MQTRKKTAGLALVGIIAVGVAGCGTTQTVSDAPAPLVLVTHDSFNLSEGTLEKFTEETGIEVEVQAAGDAGELVNKLVLTKDSPLGDVVFGIDNTFASRAVNEGVLADYASPDLTDAESQYLLPAGSGLEQLTPIDNGDVCVNVDHEWFAEAGIAEPVTLDDLVKPEYKDLFVTPAANSSSPGLAFLLATVAAYGDDGWQDYWQQLVDNGVKIDAGWSDAYYVDFSGPSSEGDRPLVVSYASSPPFEVQEGDTEAPTGALLDTCFRQTEYAGVIAGTENQALAEKLVDFLFSVDVQNDIPESMYVFPVNALATLPDGWSDYAEIAEDPFVVSPDDIDANRETWLSEWAAIATP
ncbi:thiamine transport system substrate-binding protein [Conyzicola lurida]|uniref:Thiamine transport system substrate-binding protein n=1 Tax=Conyzicola lurida TaxID=1172621 RepID=A0A841APN0_9MICO|nr:thiamine transport system substrate-binding protein [Conyzicola lurida]